MKISVSARDLSDNRLRAARQLGADGVSCAAEAVPSYASTRVASGEDLMTIRKRLASFGLEFLTLRLANRATHDILFGGPDRDGEVDRICRTVRAAGESGVPFVYYNLTPWRSLETAWPETPGAPAPRGDELRLGSGPGRRYRPLGRGGAVLLRHDRRRVEEDEAAAPGKAVAPHGRISAAEMWERIRYLYERLIPAAEEAGVNVGAHPNDPPEPVYRGVEQNLNTPEGLQKLIDLVPSGRSGLLLCIGTLYEMGGGTTRVADAMAAMERFLKQRKVFYAHFRNPKGTVPGGGYQEDFLDEGDLDMLAVMRLFREYGYEGGFDPDHAVGIEGDEDGRVAFAWEMGYMRALIRGTGQPRASNQR